MQGVGPEVLGSPPGYWRPGLDAGEGSVFVVVAAADGNPELGFDGLGDVPVGAALAEADGGDPVAGDLEFEVGVDAAVGRTGYPEAVSGDPDVGLQPASVATST